MRGVNMHCDEDTGNMTIYVDGEPIYHLVEKSHAYQISCVNTSLPVFETLNYVEALRMMLRVYENECLTFL